MALHLWFHPAIMAEYTHNAGVRLRWAQHGHTRMVGSAEAIISAGLERDWNGRSFTASPGHFNMFWTRDLCFSAPSLARGGQSERVRASLAWALAVWERRPCARSRPITWWFAIEPG